MTTTPTDLRTLRRAPRPTEQHAVPPPALAGTTTVIARPKARWLTRLLVPTAVLLATGGLLAYAARDALQPRLEVFVAAAIPKEIFANAPPTDGAEAASDTAEKPADAVLGPVAVQAPGWIEPAPYAVSVPALAEGVVKELLVLDGERVEVGQLPVRNRFKPVNPALSHHFGLELLVNRLGAIKNAVGGLPAFVAGLGPRRMPPADHTARGVQILHPALSTR